MIQQHHKIYIDKRMVRPESLTQKQCRGPQTTVEHFLDPLPHSQRYLESCFVSPVVEDRAGPWPPKPVLFSGVVSVTNNFYYTGLSALRKPLGGARFD